MILIAKVKGPNGLKMVGCRLGSSIAQFAVHKPSIGQQCHWAKPSMIQTVKCGNLQIVKWQEIASPPSLIFFWSSSCCSASIFISISCFEPASSSEQLWILDGIFCFRPPIGPTPGHTGPMQHSLSKGSDRSWEFWDQCGSAYILMDLKWNHIFKFWLLNAYIFSKNH